MICPECFSKMVLVEAYHYPDKITYVYKCKKCGYEVKHHHYREKPPIEPTWKPKPPWRAPATQETIACKVRPCL